MLYDGITITNIFVCIHSQEIISHSFSHLYQILNLFRFDKYFANNINLKEICKKISNFFAVFQDQVKLIFVKFVTAYLNLEFTFCYTMIWHFLFKNYFNQWKAALKYLSWLPYNNRYT